MSAPSKDIFAVSYRDVPGKGVIAPGGLRFKPDEAALRREYAAALEHVPFGTLLGEAALWVLWPSTAAIWTFPFLLWRLRTDYAILASIGVFLIVQILAMLFYSRALNYAGLILGNRLLQGLLYAAWALTFWLNGTPLRALALAIALVLMATGVVQVIFVTPFLPFLKVLFHNSPADQALKNVARSHFHQPDSKPIK